MVSAKAMPNSKKAEKWANPIHGYNYSHAFANMQAQFK
jgi:hypothetical protein